MIHKMQKLQEERVKLEKFYKKDFKEKFSEKIEQENELKYRELQEKNKAIKKENVKIKVVNTITGFFCALITAMIIIGVLLQGAINNLPSICVIFIIYFIVGSLFFLRSKFVKEEIHLKTTYDKIIYKEKEDQYLNQLVLPIEEMKHYYGVLMDCLGKEKLNSKIHLLIKQNEEIGSLTLLLRLFDISIKEEIESITNKERFQELDEQLKTVLNKDV